MDKYRETDRLSDIISADYRLLQVISRFGINLGFGERTVAEACEASEVHTATFITVMNYVHHPDRLHMQLVAESIDIRCLMAYLQRSHSYFIDFRLPFIRRKLIESIDCSARNQIAFLILKFYDEFAAEVARHMNYENRHIHTYVESLIAGRLPEDPGINISNLVRQHHDNHSSIEKSSRELKNIIIKYCPESQHPTQLNDVLMDIYIMEEDLFSHCRLEDDIFAEAVGRLEQSVRQRAGAGRFAVEPEQTAVAATDDTLSQREREVVRCVVRGLSNKEIAEQLFISVNTVMTHRRNIARKLEIHSAAGLTIYAISNGLLSLDEVKL